MPTYALLRGGVRTTGGYVAQPAGGGHYRRRCRVHFRTASGGAMAGRAVEGCTGAGPGKRPRTAGDDLAAARAAPGGIRLLWDDVLGAGEAAGCADRYGTAE